MKANFTLNEKPKTEAVLSVIAMQPEDANSAPTFGQVHDYKVQLKKLKYKIIAAIILGLGCIVGAVLLTYLGLCYWRSSPNTIQIFQVVLRDQSENDQIRLEIKVDPKDSLEYSTSPQEGKDAQSNEILGLKDFKKGIVAYREENGSQCFIGKIVAQSELQTYANGSIQEADVMQNETYVLLNETIHPFVLSLAAGDNIVEFCGTRQAIWMIPYAYAFEKVEKEHTRAKRWGYWKSGGSGYRRCWWNCSWWGWKKWCTRRCSY